MALSVCTHRLCFVNEISVPSTTTTGSHSHSLHNEWWPLSCIFSHSLFRRGNPRVRGHPLSCPLDLQLLIGSMTVPRSLCTFDLWSLTFNPWELILFCFYLISKHFPFNLLPPIQDTHSSFSYHWIYLILSVFNVLFSRLFGHLAWSVL